MHTAPRDLSHRGACRLDELLSPAAGVGAGLLVVRVWLMLRLRRGREPGERG